MRIQHTVAVLCVLSSVSLGAGQGIFGGRTDFTKFTAADVVFSHPEDWRAVPLPPPTIAAFSKGDDLTFSITRTNVEFPTSFNEAFAEYESQEVRKLFPGATDFRTAPVVHRTLGEILQVEFTLPAQKGSRNSRPLRHRILAVPAGLAVYRIYCVARADEFVKRHQPIFDKVIDSLIITPQPPKAGDQ
ncbi:MAG TPA: hypothetical protein VFU02_08880 [Polyangiaceae bacterium]|jgi:hypothetical protein|nr:hypothetical protein [Polyangiaceae bacterium]